MRDDTRVKARRRYGVRVKDRKVAGSENSCVCVCVWGKGGGGGGQEEKRDRQC